MAEKCITTLGKTSEKNLIPNNSTTKNLNNNGILIVEIEKTATDHRISSNIQIMDNNSSIDLVKLDDSNNIFDENHKIIENCCNVLNNNQKTSLVHLLKNKKSNTITTPPPLTTKNSQNVRLEEDNVAAVAVAAAAADDDDDDELRCNNNPEEETITTRNNDLNNLNLHKNHEKNIIYLETPVVIDENNVCCLVNGKNNHEFDDQVQAKPKRLTDEFLSSAEEEDDDDAEDAEEEDEDEDDDIIIKDSLQTLPTKLTTTNKKFNKKTSPATMTKSKLSTSRNVELNNQKMNCNKHFIPVVVSSSAASTLNFLQEEEEETNSSSCSNLINCLKEEDEDETDEPSTSSSSTTSSVTDCFIPKNQFQVIVAQTLDVNSGATSSESTVSYYENDVQSMDAIERRDFEHEQRLTGNLLLRARSLVNSHDNKINMNLIKTYRNKNKNGGNERIISSDSKFITTQREREQQQHMTTPTSSRNCTTTRLTKSTAKINLSATLDCIQDDDDHIYESNNEKKIMKLINLQASTSKCHTKSTIISSTVTSSSAVPSSGSSSSTTLTATTSILGSRLDSKNKFELYTNSNSNDSLSSDKSYSTSSNHSLPNLSNKSASCSNHSNNIENNIKKITNNIHEENHEKRTLNSNKGNNSSNSNSSDSSKIETSHEKNLNTTKVQQNDDIIKSSKLCTMSAAPAASTSKEYLNDASNFCCKEQQQRCKQDKNHHQHDEDEDDDDEEEEEVEDTAISMNLSKSIQTAQKSNRFNNTRMLDIKDSCNYNSNLKCSSSGSGATASTSSNIFSAPAVSVAAAAAAAQDDDNVENFNFEENPLIDVDDGTANDHLISEPLQLHHHENDFDDETWADCEEASDEEICTCHNSNNNNNNNSTIDFLNNTTNTEDDLPSKDVDLSSYIQMVSISEDMFLQHNVVTTDYPLIQRKRKLNDNSFTTNTTNIRLNDNENNSYLMETPTSNSRKRIALDYSSTPRSSSASSSSQQQQQQSSSGNFGSPSGSNSQLIRTPRSIIPTKDNPPPELQNWLQQFQLWSHVERLLAVDRLIEYCEPQQVRHMMKVIEPQFQRDFISLLPRELALQVLSYLLPKDLLRAAQTCRSWRYLCDDNLLWKEKCKTAQILTETTTDQPKRGRAGNMPPISSPWKAAYMRQHIIEMNWRTRPIREPKILKGHDDHVITCLQFYGNRIVSGSDDNTLKVWSAVSGKCLRTLVGHTGGVWSSQMAGNVIISGSTDRTLKVWDMETGQCIHTLLGHTSTVRCMHLHGKKVVSGSRDATLRVWDIGQGTCLHVLVGHLAAVRCVQYDGKLIVSGAYDYMVKIWHPERQECLHTLQGHTNRVYSLQFDGIHVVSGSLDTSIRVWDAETGNSKHTLMGHQSLTSGMELRSNILVSGNADSTVKVWDITTGQCLQTLSGPHKHQSAVTCLQFNSRFVVTSSDDGTVKLWDVKTGDFIRNLVALGSGGSGGVVWRIRANDTKLICAVGSRNGTEETKLMVLDFDVEGACVKCS